MLGVLLIGGVAGAFSFAGCSGGDSAAPPATERPPDILRPCNLLPTVRGGDSAPDGTYVASVVSDPSAAVKIYIDDSSAGFYFEAVPVATSVELIGYGTDSDWTKERAPSQQRVLDAVARVGHGTRSMTVQDGAITVIDRTHRRWDMAQRPDDPCAVG